MSPCGSPTPPPPFNLSACPSWSWCYHWVSRLTKNKTKQEKKNQPVIFFLARLCFSASQLNSLRLLQDLMQGDGAGKCRKNQQHRDFSTKKQKKQNKRKIDFTLKSFIFLHASEQCETFCFSCRVNIIYQSNN